MKEFYYLFIKELKQNRGELFVISGITLLVYLGAFASTMLAFYTSNNSGLPAEKYFRIHDSIINLKRILFVFYNFIIPLSFVHSLYKEYVGGWRLQSLSMPVERYISVLLKFLTFSIFVIVINTILVAPVYLFKRDCTILLSVNGFGFYLSFYSCLIFAILASTEGFIQKLKNYRVIFGFLFFEILFNAFWILLSFLSNYYLTYMKFTPHIFNLAMIFFIDGASMGKLIFSPYNWVDPHDNVLQFCMVNISFYIVFVGIVLAAGAWFYEKYAEI